MTTPIEQRLLELLALHPLGLSSQAAQTALGASQNGVCRAARALEAQGRIARMKRSHTQLMCLPEQAEATRQAMREQADLRKDAERLRKAEWRRARDAARRHWYDGGHRSLEVPVHRVVAAIDARPLRKIGPASVWELAA